MPRNRMIKPDFWSDEKVGLLNNFEKCLFIGLWNFADDEGLIKANSMYLKGSIFPYDMGTGGSEVDKGLDRLNELELIFRYKQNYQQYLWIIKFRNHQRIDKPQKPQNPAPSLANTKYRETIFKRDNYICHLCGEYTDIMTDRNIVGSNFPSIDHIIPKNSGGSDYPSNLKTACISCNKSKRDNIIPRTIQECSENGSDQKKRKEKKLKEFKKEMNDTAKAVICFLNNLSGKNFGYGEANLEPIRGRLGDGFTKEDCEKVLKTKWKDEKFDKKYYRPTTLFRPANFEAYLNEDVKPQVRLESVG